VPEAGEWLISAANYTGPDAMELARQVAVILREKHRLSAFILNRGDQKRAELDAEFKRLKALYPEGTPLRRKRPSTLGLESCAVLIGGFSDFKHATSYLKVVRNLPLPEVKLSGDKRAYEVAEIAEPGKGGKGVVRRYVISPFATAMVVRNPLVQVAPQSSFDPLWTKLNANEEYNLLRCPRRYTLLVKEYGGAMTMVQSQSKPSGFLSFLGLGSSKPGEHLNAAAMQAHTLAKFLRDRRLGFEAYVLHTRHSSVVTVGGYDNPYDPELDRLRDRIASLKFSSAQGGNDPVGLMARPRTIEIPRPPK
jgi:hypothetical protein